MRRYAVLTFQCNRAEQTGRHFAQSEITIFLVAFLHLFDVSVLPGGDTLEPDTQRIGLGILHRKGGLKVRLNRR